MDAITATTSPSVGDQATAGWADTIAGDISSIVLRIGGRATTNVAQAYSAGVQTTANNNGTAAWTATEDSGGFVSATGGTATPLVIPAGKGGLYIIGFGASTSATATTKGYGAIMINGALGGGMKSSFTGDSGDGGLYVSALTAGTTIGLAIFNNIAGNIVVGNQVFCYRIGD